MQRPRKNIKEKETVLIIANGEQEEKYFSNLTNSFRSIYTIETVFENGNALALVKLAKRKKQQEPYNQVWCVFDIDEEPRDGNLQSAIDLARKNKIDLAYSNEAFEVWLMFHYEQAIKQMPRTQYDKEMLNLIHKHISNRVTRYDNADVNLLKDSFIPRAMIAKDNSKRIYQNREKDYNSQHGNTPQQPFWEWVSTTNVFELITELKLEEKV